ncbi:hypothetical protein [Halorubrum sp. N11]|uniref:hypothetical protein n=1 Tax=Halorubrum sp. N11 TaxID=3402276 RepID=UPI003EBB3CF2
MVSDAADGPGDRTDAADGTDSPIVDRWLALDRGWQALALGLGVVAAHAAGQAVGLF